MNAHEVAQSNSATSWIMEITNCYRCNTTLMHIISHVSNGPSPHFLCLYGSCFHSHSPSLPSFLNPFSIKTLPSIGFLASSFFSPPHKSFPLSTPSSVKYTPNLIYCLLDISHVVLLFLLLNRLSFQCSLHHFSVYLVHLVISPSSAYFIAVPLICF